jgi:hypothetical protein
LPGIKLPTISSAGIAFEIHLAQTEQKRLTHLKTLSRRLKPGQLLNHFEVFGILILG